MFPNESSSDEISKTDAFIQNFKEDVVKTNGVPEQLAEWQSIGFVFSNEVTSAATCLSAHLSSTFPTDQVPVSRDTIDCTNERGEPVNMAAETDCPITSPLSQHAQMNTKCVRTTKQQQAAQQCATSVPLCWPPQGTPPAAMTILAGDCETGSLHPGANGRGIKQLNMGCESCGCTHYHSNPSSKSEALCQVSLGKAGGKAGADPTSCLFPKAIFSASVISSSSCGTAEPPSLATSHGAEQGFNAMFASHHGSSSSNSLSICAQSHTTSFTTTTTTMDVEPTHVTQANENPNTITTVSQHVINLSSVEAVSGSFVADCVPRDNLPSLDNGQSEMKAERVGEEVKFTTGALSDQDNDLINVKNFQKTVSSGETVESRQLENRDANDDSSKVWSVTPFLNIPKSQGEGMTAGNDKPSLASAMNATVQGKIDSNPPPSFNNLYTSNNVKNCECYASKLLLHCATYQYKYCNATNEGPATNARWGIPPGLGLRGGGESSLNSGTSSWGTSSGGNSNNNNNSGSSAGGWGGNNQGQGNTAAAQNQWGNNNNSVSRNTGSGGSSQGPSGQQNPGSTNKGSNAQSGQPPSQQPPPSQATSSQQQQQQQQQNGSTSWAQAAGKGLPANQQPSTAGANNSSSSNNNNPGTGNSGSSVAGGSGANSSTGNSSTKQQLEQLNTMREALFSQDGWGGQYVNQDTGWDIPASPEPGVKDGVPVWKPSVNNGTDLWEANLRNGGQPPASQAQKTPWGHTPTSNIGGTWGEDDDVGDSSNVWTGVPSSAGPGGATGQWGANSAGPSGAGKKDNDWSGGGGGGGGAGGAGSNWGDPRDPRSDPRGMDPRDPRDPRNVGAIDPRDLRGDPRDARSGMIDPRDHMRGVLDPMRGDVGMRDPRDIRGMGDIRGGDPMLRGDPRGISGRLNGGSDAGMWGQPPQPPHHHGPHHQQSQPPGKMVGPGGVSGSGVNQWVGPPPKDINMAGAGSNKTGWEEPSPPAQRRNLPNYDDGTSLWGNPAQQQGRMGGKVSHWKEMPTPSMGRGGMQCPPGMPQNRMPNNGSGNMKPDGGPLWGHAPRNGSWADGPHEAVNSGWGDDAKTGVGAVNSWNEQPLTPTSWAGSKPKNSLNPGWVDGDLEASSWGHTPKQGPKPVTKEFVWGSKQFRILVEMGYKKEDVESALRTSNMNLEDAIELLNQGRLNVETWRRHEDHSPFDLPSSHPGAGFPGQRFNPVPQQMSFAPPGPGVNNAPSLLNNQSASLASINNISPAIVQKIIAQQPPPQQPPTQQQNAFNQAPRPPQNQPSTAQLRMLVQQIQMAVQAGYLNHQILNQPLAPQTLILLNQLLQQIKVLQQLMQQQAVVQVQPLKGGSSNAVLHISVQITKTKQQISNLQNQIASQQAIYVKQQQQQQQQHHMTPQGPQPDFFKPNVHDPLTQIQANFGELNIKEPPQPTFQGQQSRLTQWKLPLIGDKEGDSGSNEFSRAPGTTTKQSMPQSHSSPNINPLGLGQTDATWSTVSRSNSDGWPEPSNDGAGQPDNKDSWPVTTQSSSAAFTDLVPEFEPGKPWKGTQIKSVEDDPSITPGSVVRSPLSLVTIKDTEIFSASGSKTSPTVSSAVDTTIPPLSLPTLSSSTWTFNPPVSTPSSFTSPLGKLGGSKGAWGEAPPPTVVTSELWGAPMGKSRGPPPGLSNKNAPGNAGTGGNSGGVSGGGGSNSSNGWGSAAGTGGGNSSAAATVTGGGGRSTSWGIQGSAAATWGSTWLLLKNLTPQIDGSTLKTLCMQHGPLQSFHLYLNHSIALAKYSSREEANKAQGALNNCVLGNTTIFAESPGDSDVHLILQHLGHGAQQQPPSGSTAGWMRGASNPSVGPTGASKGTPSSDTWAPGGSQLWNPNPSSSSLWGAAPLDTSGDQHRATPSSLNSFLPGDLLGGESM